MIRPTILSARRITAALVVAAASFALMPFSGATAQDPPRPPRAPRTPPPTVIYPGDLMDLSGLARLDGLRALDMTQLTRSLDGLRALDMSGLSRSLRDLGTLDMMPLTRSLRNLPSLDMAPLTRSLNDLQAIDLPQLSGLAQLGSLDALSNLSRLQSLDGFSGMLPLQSLDRLRDLSFAEPSWAWSADGWNNRTRNPLPPEAWQDKDPADSLYRAARKALSNDMYRRASEIYRQIRTSYPKSAYTPDAPYWEAFSLQRIGGQQELRSALEALRFQFDQFPKAATIAEARALQARLEGQLAREGDPKYVSRVENRASSAANGNCPNESEDERIDALDALIQMDAESALPMLKTVLARRDECSANLRKKAVWLVGSRKTPEAADIIINTIRTDPDRDVKETAVFWLTNAPSDRATDLLVELARTGNDTELRQRAVYSLSQLRDPRAQQALKDLVLDNSAPIELRGDAIYALTNSGRLRNSVVRTTTGGLSGQRVVTSVNGGQQSAASAGSGSGASEDMLVFLKQVYGKVEQEELKERVLQAAMQMRSDAARDWMIEIALNPKESSEARRQAVYTAGSAGASVDQLSAIYDKADDIEVRKQVLYMLTTRKDNAGIDKLLQIARTEKNTEIRKQAIYWLGRSKDPRAIQLLQDIINKK